MIRDQRIAIGLGTTAGILALVAVAQYAGLGSGYRLEPVESADSAAATTVAALGGEPVRLPPWSHYAEVLARPLFNESRAPELQESTVVVDPAAGGNAQPLNATLSGVILSGAVRLALVTDNAKGETFGVRVGQPLAGDQSGWTLVELGPRGAVFEGAGLGRQTLALETDARGATPGAPAPQPVAQPAPSAAAADPAAAAQTGMANAMIGGNLPAAGMPAQPAPGVAGAPGADPQQLANADEIRKRIEARRRELREEAQRMLQQQNQTP